MSDVLVVGLSHRTAPVEVRERLAVTPNELVSKLASLSAEARLDEAVLVSTCNRVELYASSDDPPNAIERASRILHAQLPNQTDRNVLYYLSGRDAVKHVFRVSSSLDSLVVGEPQILGQVKEAVEAASGAGTVSTLLGRCFAHAFSTAKRVRRETGIAEGTVSVSSIACELAKKIFGDLHGRRALLIGAGEMGEAAARSLNQSGANLHVVNRSDERANALAVACGGRAAPYERLIQELTDADVVIASTASPKFILTPETMQGVVRSRKRRPLFIIDIAVPRDVDPRVASMDNVFVYDVDDLQQVAEENLASRARQAAQAEQIIEEEVDAFQAWRQTLELTPTIVALRERFTQTVEAELTRMARTSNAFPEEDIKAMTRSLVNKLLHDPLTQLKTGASEVDRALLIASARRLFELDAVQEAPEPEVPKAGLSPLTPAKAHGGGESK